MKLEAAAVPIRRFLLADVLADLLQLEAHGGQGVSTGPEMLARKIPLFATQAGHRYGALPFQKSITEATGYFGGIAIHMCTWSGIRCPSMIWHSFCRANAWKISPSWRRAWPNSTLRRRFGTITTWYLQSQLE